MNQELFERLNEAMRLVTENRWYLIEVHLRDGCVDSQRFFGSFREVLEIVKRECRAIPVKEVILFEESKYKGRMNYIFIKRKKR